jgi:L-erythro-3,5-diaminohexanoate dehydrogenase
VSVSVLGSGDGARLGVHRALRPRGALTHIAEVLDADTPANEFEAEIDVEMLAVDATSFGEFRRRGEGDPGRMAQAIRDVVRDRGKLQNPWTGSGGVLMGRVRTVGASHPADLSPGELVVLLASLIAVPLRLDEIGPVDPATPHVPVRGRAIVTGGMVCGRVPDDLPAQAVLTAFDVFPAATYARDLATSGDHVLVLGSGHAGLLAMLAALPAVGAAGHVTTIDLCAEALERAARVAPGATAIQADVTDPLAVAAALSQAGLPAADLTLLCTSVTGAEGAALVATASRGTIVFFSTATRFSAAALGADAVGSQAQLVIPNGLTDDRGEYALELLRGSPQLVAVYQEHE